MDNKAQLKQNCEMLINNAVDAMRQNLQKVLNSGAIDVDSYDPNINPMILPKAIIAALLEEESDQLDPKGTAFEKQFKKDKKNVKLFV